MHADAGNGLRDALAPAFRSVVGDEVLPLPPDIMRTTKLLIRATLTFIFATTSIAIGCGSDPTTPAITDAGSKPDASAADADSGVDSGVDAAVDADATAPLAISPLAPTAKGCSTDKVLFTASGGTPPYTWSTSEGGTTNLTIKSPTQVEWTDGSDNFCGKGGTVTITVTDSLGATASAVMTVTAG